MRKTIWYAAALSMAVLLPSCEKDDPEIPAPDPVSFQSPRSMTTDKGKVYITMYNGYVARLDTASLSIDGAVRVGSNPEGITLYQDKLYVANSAGMAYPDYGTTVSVIDTETFSSSTTIQSPMNPSKFFVNETGLYLLALGNYSDIPSKAYRFNGTGFDEVGNATIMGVGRNKLYLIDAPFYGDGTIDYRVYDPQTKEMSDWDIAKVDYPNSLAIDTVGGNIMISSYIMDGQYPSYYAPGYINQYTMDGSLVKKYDIGVGPTCVFFDNAPSPVAFILCQGNSYNKLPGELYQLDINTQSLLPNTFQSVNGVSIGDTPMCGVVYGSKVYICTSESNTIEVMDRITLKSIKRISLSTTTVNL